MATVYRYFNTDTNEYDYIGIVYSENRTLDQRVYEHSKEERFDGNYKIQYFEVPTQSDAEVWEGHLISKYKTYQRLNDKKAKWGLCSYLPNDENLWLDYTPKEIKTKNVDKDNKRYRHVRDCKWNLKTIFNYDVVCFDKEVLEKYNFKHNDYVDEDGIYIHKLGIAELERPVWHYYKVDEEYCKSRNMSPEDYLRLTADLIKDPAYFGIYFKIDIKNKIGYPTIEYKPKDYEFKYEDGVFAREHKFGKHKLIGVDPYFETEEWDECFDILDLRNSWRISTCSNFNLVLGDCSLKDGEYRYYDYDLSRILQNPKWIEAINKIISNMGDLEKHGIIEWNGDSNEI